MNKRLSWQERLSITADKGSFVELDANLSSRNPINYPGYEEKIAGLQKDTGAKEAVITGKCTIESETALIGIMDSHFMMASMGSVVGEKITRLFEYGARQCLPVIIFTASGGARMQEGTVSLMQMAKTAGAAGLLDKAGQLYVTVVCDPTTGGVQASLASLGDIISAEPGATVGFAGKRVTQDTIGHSLPVYSAERANASEGPPPEHFQTSEFILEHGFADILCQRETLKSTLAKLIRFHHIKTRAFSTDTIPAKENCPAGESTQLRLSTVKLNVVQKLERLRGITRLSAGSFIPFLFEDFTELHGDRCFGDDQAIIGGIAFFRGIPVTVIAQQKGTDIEELKRTNFSMPHPEGYRKALRLARQAEKFHRPVICLIDTPGAYCGVDAEKRGQGEAIARNLVEFMELKTPVVSIVLGEGGSGGALALAVCDDLGMLENALYSVISPRGFASILWKAPSREKEAAELMKITAEDLKTAGICNTIIAEGCAVENTAENLRSYLTETLSRLCAEDPETLPAKRYARFRKMGEFSE
jgi:acetyl-CoA carboxylase carboxyl transferase subunit beta